MFFLDKDISKTSKRKIKMIDLTKDKIKKVIEEAYIQGVHESQNENLIRKGFHEDFSMLVFQNNNIQKVVLDEWMERVEKLKQDSPDIWNQKTKCEFILVDYSGNTAVVKVNVFKGQMHFSTDYMLLYEFNDGWKIVSKIFIIPE